MTHVVSRGLAEFFVARGSVDPWRRALDESSRVG